MGISPERIFKLDDSFYDSNNDLTSFDVKIQTDQKPVTVEKKVPDLLKELLKLSQRFTATNNEVKEWYDWFTSQTDLFLNSQISDHIFIIMLNRSKEFYLERLFHSEKMLLEGDLSSERMLLEELRNFEEILTIINTVLKIILRKGSKNDLTLLDKSITDIAMQDQLIEAGRRFAETDNECKEWYDWFITQKNLYEKSRLSDDVFKTIISRYRDFLKPYIEKKVKLQSEDAILISVESSPPEAIAHVSEDRSDQTSFDSIFCPSCGETNQAHYVHCVFCGSKLKK